MINKLNITKRINERGIKPLLGALVLFVFVLILYRLAGTNEFAPVLSGKVTAGWSLAAILCLILLFWFWKPFAYCAALLGLFAFLTFLASQINYIVNVFVAIDGSRFSSSFICLTAASLAAWILALAAAMGAPSVFEKKSRGRRYGRATVSFAVLLVVLQVGNELAMANTSLINSTLKCTTYKVVEDESGGSDIIEYPAAHVQEQDVKDYGYSVAKDIEAEGLVLLKNENAALPLSGGSKVSCFLNGSVNLNYSTSGSSAADTSGYGTLKEALEAADVQFEVNPTLWDFYTSGDGSSYTPKKKLNRSLGMQVYTANAAPWSAYEKVEDSISEYSDAAIVVISRSSGEGMDISTLESDGTDGSYLSLSAEEQEVLSHLKSMKEQGKVERIVVLLNTALAMRADFIDDEAYGVDACMWIGNVGCAGIGAVADVLAGNTVPSGRLSDTYVKDNFSSPAMASWMLNEKGVFNQEYENAQELGLNSTQMYYGIYREGIYVGYRYYETRYEDTVLKPGDEYVYSDVVAYPFGYGLSYTEFETSGFSVAENEDGDFDVTVTVKNVGDTYTGKEVVQIYLQKPYTDYDIENGVEKASVELAGFAKSGLLAPGEQETITVTIERESFRSYDANGAGTYILDEGDYYLTAGKNAHDAVNNILSAKGYTTADGMDTDGDASMAAIAFKQPELDVSTYALSKETGEEIVNQLDFSDVNAYSGSASQVVYVSRSDWQGTWPISAVVLSVGDELLTDLGSDKPIVEEEGLSMPVYGQDSGLTVAMLRGEPYDSEKWEQLLDQMMFSEQALLVSDGSFNTHSIGSVGIGNTFEQDGPTGVVGSKTGLSFPGEGIWASSFNTNLTKQVGGALGEDARLNQIQGLYLPGINLHRTPYGGRTNEYFSEDPLLTGWMCEAEIQGLQTLGVIAHVKHFIFNDEEAQRNGICIWLNEQAARELYLRPWEYAVSPSRGNAHGVMSSFNRAGALWTSASERLIQNILRKEFGFDGYVITDMASSNAALFMTYLDGYMNGTDLFLGSGGENVLDTWKGSVTFCNRIRESTHRLLYVLGNFSAVMDGVSSSVRFVAVTPWWQTALHAARLAAGLGLLLFGVLSILERSKRKR